MLSSKALKWSNSREKGGSDQHDGSLRTVLHAKNRGRSRPFDVPTLTPSFLQVAVAVVFCLVINRSGTRSENRSEISSPAQPLTTENVPLFPGPLTADSKRR